MASATVIGEVKTVSSAPKVVGGVITTLKSETVEAFATRNRALLNDVRVRFDAIKRSLAELQGIMDTAYDGKTGPMATVEDTAFLAGYSRIRAIKGTVKESTTATDNC